jgi:hypothetical protein
VARQSGVRLGGHPCQDRWRHVRSGGTKPGRKAAHGEPVEERAQALDLDTVSD